VREYAVLESAWIDKQVAKLKELPRAGGISSGEKYRTQGGHAAIKDGISRNRGCSDLPGSRKPSWLRAQLPTGAGYSAMRRNVREHRLATVCEESFCPNIGECWNSGTATIMLMGEVCTRACRFCAVDTGNPQGRLDPQEPANAAESVRIMDLKYIVLTSVDRDDLDDGGAAHYAACIDAIKAINPQTAVEALTPDFRGSPASVRTVVDTPIEVFAHNIETVERLTQEVRDPRANYRQSLDVLEHARSVREDVLTKSSLMLGLGETEDEILTTMEDLRRRDVNLLTLGQYLRPTLHHLPVQRYVHPDEFAHYRELGLARGFVEVVAGPMVRSSYRAEQALNKNNVGLTADLK
jgi:lipoic acid synthetase